MKQSEYNRHIKEVMQSLARVDYDPYVQCVKDSVLVIIELSLKYPELAQKWVKVVKARKVKK